MGKNSDYKKFTVGECIWCDYITKKCNRKKCKNYKNYVKKVYKPKKKNNAWKEDVQINNDL